MDAANGRSTDASGVDSSRRRLLKGAGAAATVGLASLAGCSGLLGGGGPKGAVRSYVSALNNGNAEKANNLLHPEGSMTEVSQAQLGMFEQASISVSSIEVVEEGDSRATLDVTLELSAGGASQDMSGSWEVRKQDGSWLIYSASLA